MGPLFSKYPREDAFRERDAGLITEQAAPPSKNGSPAASLSILLRAEVKFGYNLSLWASHLLGAQGHC